MNTCAFTIVAKNYIGLAMILGKSLAKHNPDIDFKIVVADEIDGEVENLPDNLIIAKKELGYSSDIWTNMSFKYNLTEFCTAIKPAAFIRLFKEEYTKVIYFDPDIFIFSDISCILSALDKFDVVLTPQIAGIHVDYSGEHPEWAMNVNGIFNLGFCGMSRSDLSSKVLEWWRKRLLDNSFADRSVGNFTDQKWMDWIPGFLGSEHLCVLNSLGMNMAPWNYFERRLFEESGKLFVSYRTDDNPQRRDPLVFLHFAGYDYAQMEQGDISRKRIHNLKDYDDIQLATSIYCKAIQEEKVLFDSFINLDYSYGKYSNGERIDNFHRRLFHGCQNDFPNPFDTGRGSFHARLKKRGMFVAGCIDKISKQTMGGLRDKEKKENFFFSVLYRIFGYKRYVLFLKSLYFYCRPELHTFLIKKK